MSPASAVPRYYLSHPCAVQAKCFKTFLLEIHKLLKFQSFVSFAKTFDALTGNEMVFLSKKWFLATFLSLQFLGKFYLTDFRWKKVLLHLLNLNVQAVTGVFNIAYGFTF